MAKALVKVDAGRTVATLAGVARQLPFAVAGAINDVAFKVQRAERDAMSAVFKHPRPFTAKSVFVEKATRASLAATIYVRPEVAKYLLPFEIGGSHVLPGTGLVALDPVGARLDQYGQLPRLSTQQLSGRPDIFVGPVQTKSGVISGFWQRVQINRQGNARRKRLKGGTIYSPEHGALRLLIRFGDALPVHQHLDFQKRADAVVTTGLDAALARAISAALASAKR